MLNERFLERQRGIYEALQRCAAASNRPFEDWVGLLRRKTCDAHKIEEAFRLGMSFEEIEAGSESLVWEVLSRECAISLEQQGYRVRPFQMPGVMIGRPDLPERVQFPPDLHPELKRIHESYKRRWRR